jgi:hypothetical protein
MDNFRHRERLGKALVVLLVLPIVDQQLTSVEAVQGKLLGSPPVVLMCLFSFTNSFLALANGLPGILFGDIDTYLHVCNVRVRMI